VSFCDNGQVNASNPRTQIRNELISYYKTNGITSLKKYVDVDHAIVAICFKEKMNSSMKGNVKRQPTKKRTNMFEALISSLFDVNNSFKKYDVQHKKFLESLGLLIVKNNLLVHFVKSCWLKHLALHLCPRIHFPSKRKFS
jgi:hypothetical protein